MKFTQSRAFRYTLGFAIVGSIATILIAYVERNILSTYQRNLPYVNLGDNIKNRTTKGHLWFEEIMAGDQSLDFEKDVINLFTSSRDILTGAHLSQDTEMGKFERIDDEVAYDIIKQAITDVETLATYARERYKLKLEADANVERDSLGNIIISTTGEAAGGVLDQKFDEAYEEFQVTMDRLVNHINEKVNKDSDFLSTLSWISIVLVAAVFGLLCTLIFRLQLGNDKMVAINNAKLEEETKRMDSIADFIGGVSSGNYSVELTSISENEGLGVTLANMRNKLRNNAETDRRRNWSTTGLAEIGDILRANNTSTEQLYDNIIRFVVKYTNSNQGGLFIFNDEDENNQHLELVACYAFERKKYMAKKVDVGEGLVGQCFVEGERIYLLDVPEEYITITSGLGGANPSALLLVPMKVNEKMYGVIEVASFRKYEDFEIELIEKLAESIASTISTVRTNESTRILLEKTQQQTEEMRAQEEEMRQNMEELEATQEQTNRQMQEIERVKKDLDVRENVFALTTILSESDLFGTITTVNNKLCEVAKYTREEMIGKAHNLFRHPDMPKELFKLMWDKLKSGEVFRGIVKNKAKDGTHYWVDAAIVPVRDDQGKIVKYVGARYHITNDKMALELYNKQAEKLNLPLL